MVATVVILPMHDANAFTASRLPVMSALHGVSLPSLKMMVMILALAKSSRKPAARSAGTSD